MAKLRVKELTLESFSKYGAFARMIDPDWPKIGQSPIEFHRDMVPLYLHQAATPMFSICRVAKRPPVIDVTEYHSRTGEGILPLDADVAIHVGIATPDGEVPLDKMEVFRVPKGTFVAIRPGVWHHAPFVCEGETANVLIVLPERTYTNDCTVVEIPQPNRLEIAGI
ncbi:MAG: ureidoglycolate lyase [Planctomycetota bacterium]